jgi:hypothetical protein
MTTRNRKLRKSAKRKHKMESQSREYKKQHALMIERVEKGHSFYLLNGEFIHINLYNLHFHKNLYKLIKKSFKIPKNIGIIIARKCLNDNETKILSNLAEPDKLCNRIYSVDGKFDDLNKKNNLIDVTDEFRENYKFEKPDYFTSGDGKSFVYTNEYQNVDEFIIFILDKEQTIIEETNFRIRQNRKKLQKEILKRQREREERKREEREREEYHRRARLDRHLRQRQRDRERDRSMRERDRRERETRKRTHRKYKMDSCESYKNNTGQTCPRCCSAHKGRCKWMGKKANPKCQTISGDAIARRVSQPSIDNTRIMVRTASQPSPGVGLSSLPRNEIDFRTYTIQYINSKNNTLTNDMTQHLITEAINTYKLDKQKIELKAIIREIASNLSKNKLRMERRLEKLKDEMTNRLESDILNENVDIDQFKRFFLRKYVHALNMRASDVNEILEEVITGETSKIILNYYKIQRREQLKVQQEIMRKMSELDISDEEDIDKCVICYENLYEDDRDITIDCGHIFHKECLTEWEESSKTNRCPVCREKYKF